MGRQEILYDLKKTLDDAKARIDALAPKSRDIYVFGAGNTAHLYKKCFEAEDFHPKAYLDNNKAGGKFNGVDITAPGDVFDRNNALVLICSSQPKVNSVVSKQLEGLGLKNINVKIIRRDRPKIAVCIYHNTYDMFRIQLWLDGLNLGYKFAVRQHSFGCLDTILYAWQ